MNITIDNARLRIAFRYDAATKDRLKQLTGSTWDKESKCWFLPLHMGDKLLATFQPSDATQYSYEALCACWDAQAARTATFAAGLVRMGVSFAIDASGGVYAVGDNVSPVLADMVTQRSDDLRAWVDISMPVVTDDDLARNATLREKDSNVTHGDRLWHEGVQNAAKRAAEKAQWAQRGRVERRRGIEQAELYGDGMAQVDKGG